jgi:hypothetical protein
VFPYLILGIALLIGVLLAGRWFVDADPKLLAKFFKWLSLILLLGVILFLAVSGRLNWIFVALPALMMWFMRFRRAARMAKNFSRMAGMGGGSQSSDVETRFLRMSLDHGTGTMDGQVIDGPFAGRTLGSMSVGELTELLRTCWVEDEQSARILESYLDRGHEGWRDRAGESGAGAESSPGPMSRDQALRVLGLEDGAADGEVKDAHRRLMAGMHPDHGGSTYLASQINQAREVLLGKG